MPPTMPLGVGCIENWAGALHSEAVSCMLPVSLEIKMEMAVNYCSLRYSAGSCLGDADVVDAFERLPLQGR
jgi:hypothetical protein